METKHIKISDYNYSLPEERIAKFPLLKRDNSKLLVYKHGQIMEDHFFNLSKYLPQGSLMVFNNTKVIQARLYFKKETGATIEIFLMEPAVPKDYELILLISHNDEIKDWCSNNFIITKENNISRIELDRK